jgi:hypothetical protein
MILDLDGTHWVLAEVCTTFLSFSDKEYILGFIYMITNTINNKKYIGKKQCWKTIKMPPLKGKRNKRHKLKETDWKSYTGSCNDLNNDIKEHGMDTFKFEILQYCRSKWELSYYELKQQMNYDVLVAEGFYNGIINVRIGKCPKLTRDDIIGS